jgi:dolichol-phosphate mannosyltransferase
VGYRTGVVLYDRQDRAGGEGKLTFLSRIKYAMDAITSFSYKPLRFSFALSGVTVLLAAVFAVSAFFSKSSLNPVGFGVAAAIFLVGGFLLFCLGVLGEYLGRVYDEVRRRPLSIISKVHYASQLSSAPAEIVGHGDVDRPLRVA